MRPLVLVEMLVDTHRTDPIQGLAIPFLFILPLGETSYKGLSVSTKS